jgi:predicted ATPase
MEQPGFTKLAVQGYRRLADISIDFTGRSLAVIVGANGTGKTSLLKSLQLLSGSAKGKLRTFLSEEGGITDILTRDKSRYIYFRSEVIVDSASYLYQLVVSRRGLHYELSEDLERLTDLEALIHMRGSIVNYYDDPQNPSRPANLGYQPDISETSLSQVPRSMLEIEAFRKRLASVESYSGLDVSATSPIRLPQSISPGLLPLSNGEETISVLYNLRESDPDRFEVVEDSLRVVFPDFEALSFEPVARGQFSLRWKDKGFDKSFYINELSEGTVRFLWLCAILYSPQLPQVLIIDEPEVSMHPVMLRTLALMLREASLRTQVIVATHSETLVSFLKPEELLICDLVDGAAKFEWADQKEDLSHWLEDYTLGQLWSMNVFGGRP